MILSSGATVRCGAGVWARTKVRAAVKVTTVAGSFLVVSASVDPPPTS